MPVKKIRFRTHSLEYPNHDGTPREIPTKLYDGKHPVCKETIAFLTRIFGCHKLRTIGTKTYYDVPPNSSWRPSRKYSWSPGKAWEKVPDDVRIYVAKNIISFIKLFLGAVHNNISPPKYGDMVATTRYPNTKNYLSARVCTWKVIRTKLQFERNPKSWIHELKYIQAIRSAVTGDDRVTDYDNLYCVEFEDGTIRYWVHLYELKTIHEISLYNYCSFDPLNREHIELFSYVNKTQFISRLARAAAVQSA
jgi:hypothetical protein